MPDTASVAPGVASAKGMKLQPLIFTKVGYAHNPTIGNSNTETEASASGSVSVSGPKSPGFSGDTDTDSDPDSEGFIARRRNTVHRFCLSAD